MRAGKETNFEKLIGYFGIQLLSQLASSLTTRSQGALEETVLKGK